jgi:hypothetical protein
VTKVRLPELRIDPEAPRDRRVEAPEAPLDVLGRDERVRIRVAPFGIHEIDPMEDLHRLVRVHRRDDLRDGVQVAVDELAEPHIVLDRPAPRPPRHEQLEVRDAERVLDVDDDEAEPALVLRGRSDAVPSRPLLSLRRSLLVWDPPDLADPRRIEMGR